MFKYICLVFLFLSSMSSIIARNRNAEEIGEGARRLASIIHFSAVPNSFDISRFVESVAQGNGDDQGDNRVLTYMNAIELKEPFVVSGMGRVLQRLPVLQMPEQGEEWADENIKNELLKRLGFTYQLLDQPNERLITLISALDRMPTTHKLTPSFIYDKLLTSPDLDGLSNFVSSFLSSFEQTMQEDRLHVSLGALFCVSPDDREGFDSFFQALLDLRERASSAGVMGLPWPLQMWNFTINFAYNVKKENRSKELESLNKEVDQAIIDENEFASSMEGIPVITEDEAMHMLAEMGVAFPPLFPTNNEYE